MNNCSFKGCLSFNSKNHGLVFSMLFYKLVLCMAPTTGWNSRKIEYVFSSFKEKLNLKGVTGNVWYLNRECSTVETFFRNLRHQ